MRPIPKSSAVLISLFILAVVFIAPPATRGDEWNQMTRFAVNHPFEVPEMTLQPYPKEQALEIARHAKEPILAAETVNLHDLSAVKVETISPLGAETAPTATAENVPKAEVPPVEEAKPAPPVAEEQQPAPPAPPEQQRSVAENKPPEVQPPPAPPALPAQTPAPAPAPTEQPAGQARTPADCRRVASDRVDRRSLPRRKSRAEGAFGEILIRNSGSDG